MCCEFDKCTIPTVDNSRYAPATDTMFRGILPMEDTLLRKKGLQKPINPPKIETAVYVNDLLGSLQKVVANKDMSMLAHLIGLAKMEAKRCTLP
jgi:hypothetical protein